MGTVRYKIIGDEVVAIHDVVVKKFSFSPDSIDSHLIRNWFQSDQGQFVVKHALGNPKVESIINSMKYDTDYYVIAELEEKRLSEFYLRWGKYGNDQT